MIHKSSGRLGSLNPGLSIKIVFLNSSRSDHAPCNSYVTLFAESEAANSLLPNSELIMVLLPSPSLPITKTTLSVGLFRRLAS